MFLSYSYCLFYIIYLFFRFNIISNLESAFKTRLIRLRIYCILSLNYNKYINAIISFMLSFIIFINFKLI
jgi:hypothetical protein